MPDKVSRKTACRIETITSKNRISFVAVLLLTLQYYFPYLGDLRIAFYTHGHAEDIAPAK